MKYLILLSFLFIFTASEPVTKDCKCDDTELFGRVRFVNDGGDFRIRFVQNNPDLRIQFVARPASKCGQWQIVDGGEDFTVYVVAGGEDFTVQYSESNPGIN